MFGKTLTRIYVRSKIISEGGNSMKEMFKSKIMILFIAVVLGVTYFHSLQVEKLEDESGEEYHNYIAFNIN